MIKLHRQSISFLAHEYGGLKRAATLLGYSSIAALRAGIAASAAATRPRLKETFEAFAVLLNSVEPREM